MTKLIFNKFQFTKRYIKKISCVRNLRRYDDPDVTNWVSWQVDMEIDKGDTNRDVFDSISSSCENPEIPPPLPPRRRFTQNAYADITAYSAYATKSKKSTWNLMNVFGRNKMAAETVTTQTNAIACIGQKGGKTEAGIPYTKNRNISTMSKSRSENLNIDLLARKHSSFSTPDLTNIVDVSQQPNDEDADLDIMDIERSNSLNSSANQFLSRPPPLNISSNILWSHNLSSTFSSNFDSSAINLVGANVNGNSILRDDLSGYCQMAPIIRNKSPPSVEQNSPVKIRTDTGQDAADGCITANRLIENGSGYCQMAPIINKEKPTKPATHQTDLVKKVTFDSKYESEEDCFSLVDFSLLSNNKHSSNCDSTEENSSSGVSSDEGVIYTSTSLNLTKLSDSQQFNQMTNDIENDDAVSIACTESPNIPSPLNHSLPFHTTKFDEKYPSYFPNTNCTTSPLSPPTNRHTVNNNRNESATRKPLYERQKSKCIEPIAQPTDASPSTPHINCKKTNCKTVIKTTPAKVQKTKQRKSSSENVFVGTPIAVIVAGDENRCSYHRKGKNHKNSENCKFKINQSTTHKPTIESKNVLTHADGNAKLYNFDKNVKMLKQASSSSSPRRIYNKCATLATRLKTPPTTPIDAAANTIEFNCSRSGSCSTLPSISKSYSFDVVDGPNSVETNTTNKDGIGLLRFASLSRFRKIDFSPLKVKINNILQQTKY